MSREEGDDGVGVGGGDGGEERGAMEGASVEEVGRFCRTRSLAVVRVDARFEVRSTTWE